MYRIVWEYEVVPETVTQFEQVYGPQGAWAQFFRKSEAYAATELFKSTSDPHHFVTVDLWHSRDAYENFRKMAADEYAALDESCQKLLRRERALGVSEDRKKTTGRSGTENAQP